MGRSWTKNHGSDNVAYFDGRVRAKRKDSQIDAPKVQDGFCLTNLDRVLAAQARGREAQGITTEKPENHL